MGIQHECIENDIDFDILYNDNDLKKNILATKYHGVIVLGKFCDDTKEFIESTQTNIVYADSKDVRYKYDSVWTDFRSLTNDVMYYLLDKGHEKIGYIGGREIIPLTFSEVVDPRELEFQEIMYRNNVYNSKYFKAGYYSIESGYNLAKELLDENISDLPTALFCGSDSIALGVSRLIQESGLSIPKDIAIFSVNDIPTLQYTSPSLSTVKIYTEFLGGTALRLLLEQMNNARELKVSISIPYELIFRESA